MSRETRFRAWSLYGKRMLDVRDIDFSNRIINSEYEQLFFSEIELMQYTGLKDKNGVEIWEGDIVSYQYPQKQLKNHQQLCKIVYAPKAAAFLLKPPYFEPQVKYLGDIARSNKQYDTRTYELCEVIGNIYENPELSENGNE